jgi:hypothetical protein
MNKSSLIKAGVGTTKKNSKIWRVVAIIVAVLLASTVALTIALQANPGCPEGSFWGRYPLPNEVRYGCIEENVEDKPIIYIYPTETTEVSVQVSHPENFTTEYPRYGNGWRVLAQPNGDLTDLNNNNRGLYSLYYESRNEVPAIVQKDGFVVKGSDTTVFLEEKLAALGLSAREAEEFIIYWLPQLQDSPYNYIRFQTAEEIDTNQALDISPKPDTLIRIIMSYRPLDSPIAVQTQQLPKTPARIGFTVVEWGGTRIDSSIQR